MKVIPSLKCNRLYNTQPIIRKDIIVKTYKENIPVIVHKDSSGKLDIEVKLFSDVELQGLSSAQKKAKLLEVLKTKKWTPDDRVKNLVSIIDGYFEQGGHHININCINREMLQDAIDHPERYPGLTLRVSGYAVHFTKLTRQQQLEVIARTFHETI